METVTWQGTDVKRCTGCKGLWFDALEERKLAKLKGSEVIDDGDPDVGKSYNDVRIVDCPRCTTRMVRMVDPKQHHIWYESCTSCGGVFFDAGEFRDFKERSFLDYLEDFFTKERR